MEKTQRETGRLDFPEVTVPVTPCWFLLACEISFSNHSLKAPRSLCWAWSEDVVAWLPPLVCKCVEVTREDWWLWGLECLALKPALYSQVLMTVFYQNRQMVILLYIECGAEEVLSFCWVLLTLGIFYISLLVFSELVGFWREKAEVCVIAVRDTSVTVSLSAEVSLQAPVPKQPSSSCQIWSLTEHNLLSSSCAHSANAHVHVFVLSLLILVKCKDLES